MSGTLPPPRLAPPPTEESQYDAFERETLKSLNESLRGVLTLGRESNRQLGKLADILSIMHETSVAARELALAAIAEQQLTREAIRTLTDEISLWRAEHRADIAAANAASQAAG